RWFGLEQGGRGEPVAVAGPRIVGEVHLGAFPSQGAWTAAGHGGDVAVVLVEWTVRRKERRPSPVRSRPPPARPRLGVDVGGGERWQVRLNGIRREFSTGQILAPQRVNLARRRVSAQDTTLECLRDATVQLETAADRIAERIDATRVGEGCPQFDAM